MRLYFCSKKKIIFLATGSWYWLVFYTKAQVAGTFAKAALRNT